MSTQFYDRTFWTCRDTQHVNSTGYVNQKYKVWDGSASWSCLDDNGPVVIDIPDSDVTYGTLNQTQELVQYATTAYGEPFYGLSGNFNDLCGNNTSGNCGNGTRFPRSIDSAPLITCQTDEQITAYTWVRNREHQQNVNLNADPSTSFYRVDYTKSDDDSLPKATLLNTHFWEEGHFAYGAAGGLVVGEYAYLYAQSGRASKVQPNLTVATAVARVCKDSVEDITQYQYYVNGEWTSEMPSIDDPAANLTITAGGIGTFFWSQPWGVYVWIGGEPKQDDGKFWISVSEDPVTGWTEPTAFFTGPNGINNIARYGNLAHPTLQQNPNDPTTYIGYTRNNRNPDPNIKQVSIQNVIYKVEWKTGPWG